MKPFKISEYKFSEIDTIIRCLPKTPDDFWYVFDPDIDVSDEVFYNYTHYDQYSYFWWDWCECPMRKRQQTINEIIEVPTGRTIGENAILV